MRNWLFLSLLIALSPCMAADKPVPPNGQQILQIFLEHVNKPLKDEPKCQMQPWRTFDGLLASEGDYDPDDPKFLSKTLAEFIAAQVGDDSLYSEDKNFLGPTIDTYCDPELQDLTVPGYPHGWICSVNIGTGSQERPRFSVTTIRIIIKPDLSGIIPGTIGCW